MLIVSCVIMRLFEHQILIIKFAAHKEKDGLKNYIVVTVLAGKHL